jgi:hypothetical protein
MNTIAKNYLVAAFVKSNPKTLGRFCRDHTAIPVRDSTLENRHARVLDGADVTLDDDDTVWIDRFGRVNGFRHGIAWYVVGES